MKAFGAATLLALASFTSSVLADVDPIVIKGSKFFYKTNGTQFYIKGVAYQQDYTGGGASAAAATNTDYTDPLADATACARDIPYLVKLGTNVIRTYAIDPTLNHDACMSMLANAGIYVISDLSAPGDSINRDDPAWNDELFARYTAVVDNLQKYNNVMGFFAGNEVSNNASNTDAAAFVKAAVRDTKAYIKSKGYRTIGVGYATNDDADIRVNLANYFDCGSSAAAVDFWGYNIYSWCGDSSYTLSGYDERTAEFSKFNIPVFFAEYGCNKVQPRTFTEVSALFGPNMNSVWSGGIVYMYFQEANDYGLVSVSGSSVSTLSDFNYLSSQIASVTVTGVNSASYTPTNTAAASCPTVNATWQASTNLPPTPNQALCSCMYNALSCVPNNVAEDQLGALFGVVCGYNDGSCNGIVANGTSGNYGAYSMCNSTEQLGWVLNTYYQKQRAAGNGASACSFGGSATIKSVTTPTGSCSSLISQAGAAGTGSLSASGTGSSGHSSSKSSAPTFVYQSVNFGSMHIAVSVLAAIGSGVAMIVL